MSYNIHNLPIITIAVWKPRLDALLRFLETQIGEIDVFFFQEVFTDGYLDGLKDFFVKHNFYVVYGNPRTNYFTLVNSGLFVATKYKPEAVRGINFSDCLLFDCFSKKAAISFKIRRNERELTLVNVHLQDSVMDIGGSVRVKQLKEIKAFGFDEKTTIVGDMNIKSKDTEIVQYAKQLFGKVVYPDTATFQSGEILDGAFGNVQRVVSVEPEYDDMFVSDHFPIIVTI